MRADIRLCMYSIFVSNDNYACNEHTENSNKDRHSLKQVHLYKHTHTNAAENMVLQKLEYELETLQTSHAPKYEIDRVEKMRANCRCVPHTHSFA